MDGSALEHSDSDSGESWTLLDHSPSYADDAPQFAENPKERMREVTETNDIDEDTDGISIISDSDPESSTPCDLCYEKIPPEEIHPTEDISEFLSANTIPTHINTNDHESIRSDDDFLRGPNGKLKTYVHKRNKRLSTVLNIIVLGSVITAAGVAIGHMWGARNDCSVNTPPSVNKILSNLYKLQEENAYLRSKLKELTLLSNIQSLQKKIDPEKSQSKHYKCKKVFEEPLNNKKTEKCTKCIENEKNLDELDSHLREHGYEKEFINDIEKLKNVYQQNKSWLDEEISKRIKIERGSAKRIKRSLKSLKSTSINVEHNILTDKTPKKRLDSVEEEPVNTETVINVTEPSAPTVNNIGMDNLTDKKKVTYAESLKSDTNTKRLSKKENDNIGSTYKNNIQKRKSSAALPEEVTSDDDFIKDDRYMEPQHKLERKKNDRQKSHKKQKRRNKYEQWEMKGGYMKDYDDFSMTSQENDYFPKFPNNNVEGFNQPETNYKMKPTVSQDNVDSDTKFEKISKKRIKVKEKLNKEKEQNWYDKRAALRTEARKKLEQELFGDTTPNNAGWYFRRMQRREQCRVKGDNTTYRKFSKRFMNFKTKH